MHQCEILVTDINTVKGICVNLGMVLSHTLSSRGHLTAGNITTDKLL